MKNIFTKAGVTLGLAVGLAASSAFAQSASGQGGSADNGAQQRSERMEKRHKRGGRGMRILSELNLTDAQKQQIHDMHERHGQSIRAQREELHQIFQQRRAGGTLSAEQEARAQTLRAELKESNARLHNEMLNSLTPEQRARFEQIKQEHKARREERRGRRGTMQNNEQ